MASLVEHEETDEHRLLKTVAYIMIVDDYCKQIIRESDTMKRLGYKIREHTDDDLTKIIKNNFYSVSPHPNAPNPVFLRLNHTPGTNHYIEIEKGCFPESFLDINCEPFKYFDFSRLKEVEKQHKDDKYKIADRNFSEWVCIISNTDLLILIIHHNYRT